MDNKVKFLIFLGVAGAIGYFIYKSDKTAKQTASDKINPEDPIHRALLEIKPDVILPGGIPMVSYSAYVKAQKAGLLPGVGPLPEVWDWKGRGI